MVIAMTACFVSGFLFVNWNGGKAVQSYVSAERCELDLFMFDLDMGLIMLTLKILFIPESTEGFSDEAVQLMRVELGDRNLMV